MQLTYRYRIKDKHAKRLNAQARAVNFVWNYCNETQMKAARDGRKWLSGYDLGKLVAGATKEGLDLHSHSAKRVCIQYDKSRRQHKKPWLRWRSRRSLGWVPFNTGHVHIAMVRSSSAASATRSGCIVRCRRARESARARSPRTPEGAGTSTAQSRSVRAYACQGLGDELAGSALTSASRT